MNFLDEAVNRYLRGQVDRFDDPVLVEMEALAEQKGFPIVGRLVGATLEMLATSIGARRIFEMGSGFGFSAYWFARAAGDRGEVFLTDGDANNEAGAKEYLTKAGLWDRCTFVVGDAIQALDSAEGEFDIVYCDIDKGDYPAAFEHARNRVRPGGLYICDNVLWSGRVARDDDDAWTEAIRTHNEMIAKDEEYLSSIIPLRDGLMVALRKP